MTKEYFQIPHTDIDKHWDLFAVLIQKAIDKVDNNDYSIFGTMNQKIFLQVMAMSLHLS